MRHGLVMALVAALAGCEPPADGPEPVWIFYSGQEFLAIGDTAPDIFARKEMYLAGLNDGLNLVAGRERHYRWIADCALDRPLAELRSLFENWLRSHPDRLGEPAPDLYLEALRAACVPPDASGE